MKKLILLAATLFAAISFDACNKVEMPQNAEDTQTPASVQDIKVIANISGINGTMDTKAIRTGWKEGDKINIWFNGDYWKVLPELILTYDGTQWTPSKVNADLSGSSSVPFAACYEESNELFSRTYSNSALFYPSFDITAFKQTVYNSSLTCTYSGTCTYADKTLTIDINEWRIVNPVNVHISGIEDTDRYLLRFYYLSPLKFISLSSGAFSIASVFPFAFTTGVRRDDGLSFPFTDYSSNSFTAQMDVLDRNTNIVYRHTKTGASIPSGNVLKSIKTDFSKFKAFGCYSNGMYYTFGNKNTVAVTNAAFGYTVYSSGQHYSGNVTIPSTITVEGNEYTVTDIGSNTFKNDTDLTSVSLCEGITSIGANAFMGCTGLTELVLPKTLSSINTLNAVFSGCKSLVIKVDPENPYFLAEGGALYKKNAGATDAYTLYCLMESATGDVVIKDGTTTMTSGGIMTVNASSVELPRTMSYLTNAFYTIEASPFVLKLNYQSYDEFNTTLWSKINATSGIRNRNKIDLQVPAVTSDEDIEKYKALKFKSVTRR